MNIKKKQRLSIVAWLVITALVVCILLFVSWLWYIGRYEGVDLDPPVGFEAFHETSYYKINPERILMSLDLGEENVFTPEIATPENPIFEQPFSWHQADYLKIASALHQFAWKEPLNDWNLYSMHFNTACRDNPDGFGFGEFVYFKIIPYKIWLKDYEVQGLQIAPQYGNVGSGGSEYYPGPLFGGWKSIDLDKVKVTAEEALRIGEENGGQAARLSVQNNCTIRVRLSGYSGWWVRITENDTASEVFSLEIDPYTGKIK